MRFSHLLVGLCLVAVPFLRMQFHALIFGCLVVFVNPRFFTSDNAINNIVIFNPINASAYASLLIREFLAKNQMTVHDHPSILTRSISALRLLSLPQSGTCDER